MVFACNLDNACISLRAMAALNMASWLLLVALASTLRRSCALELQVLHSLDGGASFVPFGHLEGGIKVCLL
jgi:hypothetical protein